MPCWITYRALRNSYLFYSKAFLSVSLNASVTVNNQKNPRVRNIFLRNSGAGNGCANFMGAWKNAFFLQEKPCP